MIDVDDPSVAARNPEPFIRFSPATIKEERDANPEPFNRPDIRVGSIINKRVKVQVAAKAENGVVTEYKRQVPVDKPAKAENGVITEYKRQVPVDKPSKSENGVITEYKRQVPVDKAAKAENGVITEYKRDEVPVEQAATTVNGEIVAYGRDLSAAAKEAAVAKRNVLKLSSPGPARRGGRLYKRAHIKTN